MKYFLILIGVFLVVVSCLLEDFSSVATAQNGGKNLQEEQKGKGAVIDNATHDFGKVSTSFIITNNTTAYPVSIIDVQSSFGCVILTRTEEPIEAEKTGRVQVPLTAKGRLSIHLKDILPFVLAPFKSSQFLFRGKFNKHQTLVLFCTFLNGWPE